MLCILWPFLLLGVLCSSSPASTLEVTINNSHYYAARGSDVKRACSFTHDMTTMHFMDIKWTVVFGTEDERHILWLVDGVFISETYKPLTGRVRFTSSDPTNGDASIIIKDVRLSDSGSYRCFVNKLPEKDLKTLELTVMELPSKPQCSADREFA
ncbi:coxsackievirus and adenovirus receptor homolog [Syngnathoides biaculeatus]|uniref:coxsackievirus and adenovirus receptor homolog n=1 Tax=Syngnathoides biaculeatus TaxID=300417 RepID=UPI002ADDFD0F|nr:coxsackievirus and adenovirus receptor homolog [Syngnathoides biaculeatus]